MRAKVKSAEKTLGAIKRNRPKLKWLLGHGEKTRKIADFSIKLAKIEAAIIDAEQDWLVVEEALDTAQKLFICTSFLTKRVS